MVPRGGDKSDIGPGAKPPCYAELYTFLNFIAKSLCHQSILKAVNKSFIHFLKSYLKAPCTKLSKLSLIDQYNHLNRVQEGAGNLKDT